MTLVRKYGKVILGILVLVTLLLVTKQVPLAQWLDEVVEPLRRLGWVGVALYSLLYITVGMFGLPCLPLTLASGYIFGAFKGLVAVQSGAMIGASAGFLVGRIFGRARLARRLQHSPLYRFLDGAIAKEGWKIVALLRLHPIPFGLSNYLYGMTSLDFWHYLLATSLAMLPGHIIFGHLGAVGGRVMKHGGPWSPMDWAAVILSVSSSLLLIFVVKRWVKKYRQGTAPIENIEP